MKPVDLNPDNPHDAARTMQLADTAAAAVRCLNYATAPGKGGIRYPGDAYELLGYIGNLTARLPQLCDQLRDFLIREQRSGHLQLDEGAADGESVTQAVMQASDALLLASGRADELLRLLARAQENIRSVRYAESAR